MNSRQEKEMNIKEEVVRRGEIINEKEKRKIAKREKIQSLLPTQLKETVQEETQVLEY